MPDAVWTIGHSNRSLEEFIGMLRAHGIRLLADVRTVPRSRHNPQFNRDTLPASLAAEGVEYVHMPGLGGLRHPRKDSSNTGWRNASFRGYADYMGTPEFERQIEDLLHRGASRRVALMCAESVPWRCHRSLIADALTARGVPVQHIMTVSKSDAHRLTSFARVDGERVTYPSPAPALFE